MGQMSFDPPHRIAMVLSTCAWLACSPASESAAPVRSDAALSAPDGCFTEHVRDAIALNEARRAVYSEMSGGRSQLVSTVMISSEYLLLPVAAAFDLRAYPLQQAGIPIMCDELVSMDGVAALEGFVTTKQRPALVDTLDAGAVRDAAQRAYRTGGFGALSLYLEGALHALEAAPDYLCMTRHILESALRASNLAEGHARAARERRLWWSRPERLSWDFISTHLEGLPAAHFTDRLAAPLQEDGIPIICHDVPPIPPR